jgi:pyruvate-ferredoxin/flavodoxin oxidoreductase
MQQQTRFKMLQKSHPEDAKRLWAEAQNDAETRFHMYEYLAQRKSPIAEPTHHDQPAPVAAGK